MRADSPQTLASLPMRGEWIEIAYPFLAPRGPESLPMRGEWIEIMFPLTLSVFLAVSPHAGRVD